MVKDEQNRTPNVHKTPVVFFKAGRASITLPPLKTLRVF